MSKQCCIVVFSSTHFALRAECAVHKAGIAVRMIPVPRQISTDCNLGMETSIEQRDMIRTILSVEGIECDVVIWNK